MLAISRRHFCAAALPVAISPALLFLSPALAETSRDAKILAAVEAWLDLSPVLDVILQRDDASEWEWDRVAAIADQHLTYATNTRAVTVDGIEAKIRLYRAALEFFVDDGDYMREKIEQNLAALSSRVEA